MRLAPAVGALIGLVLAGALWAMRAVGTPALLAGVVVTGLAVLLSRGMHLDGLADTVDAFGSYGAREKALAVMRSPEIGPFGVAAIVLVLLAQAASYTSVTPAAVIAAAAAGRLAAAVGCRRAMPAARPDGLGALVAGTVGIPAILVNLVLVAGLAWWAVPGRPWQGPAAVAVSLAVAYLITLHAGTRLGGVTGDVLGLLVETGTTLTLIGTALGPI